MNAIQGCGKTAQLACFFFQVFGQVPASDVARCGVFAKTQKYIMLDSEVWGLAKQYCSVILVVRGGSCAPFCFRGSFSCDQRVPSGTG